MRLLLTSDWHDDAITLGVERRTELLKYLDRITRAVRDEAVDVPIFSGDAFDPGSMMQSQYEVDVICAFRGLAQMSTRGKLVAVAGNHDVVEVARPLSTLSPAANAGDGSSYVAEIPSVFSLHENESSSEGVSFLLLPYISRAWADAERNTPGMVGPAALTDIAFETAATLRRRGHRIVVVGHMTVAGAVIGSESVEMSRGRDLDLPIERIRALEPTLVVNGHYHRPQVVDVGGLQIVIPGSPLSFTTDDPSDGKGYVIAEV